MAVPESRLASPSATAGAGSVPDARFDARDFRAALGSFGTGVTIITARRDGGLVGVTANSFSSVSLDPPLVLWSLAHASPSLAAFQAASHFAVNVLAEDQVELSRRFGRSGGDKFAGVRHGVAACGAPLILGASAHFECRTTARYDGGDHVIFLGRVERYAHTDTPTLLFSRGRYVRAQPPAVRERAELLSFWEV